jgi:hypothetical protein
MVAVPGEIIGTTRLQPPGGTMGNRSGPDWPPKLPGPGWPPMPPDAFGEFRRPPGKQKKPQKNRQRQRSPRAPGRPTASLTGAWVVVMSAAAAAVLILLAALLVWQL